MCVCACTCVCVCVHCRVGTDTHTCWLDVHVRRYVECMAELGDKSTGPFASEAASLHELLLDGGVPEAGEDGLAVQFKALKPKVCAC